MLSLLLIDLLRIRSLNSHINNHIKLVTVINDHLIKYKNLHYI